MKKVIFSLCLFFLMFITAERTLSAEDKNYRIEKCPKEREVVLLSPGGYSYITSAISEKDVSYKNNKVFVGNPSNGSCRVWKRDSRWEDNLKDLEEYISLSWGSIVISIEEKGKRKYASFDDESFLYHSILGRNILPGDIVFKDNEYKFLTHANACSNYAHYVNLLGKKGLDCLEEFCCYAPKGKELEEIKEKFKPILEKLFKKDETCMIGFKKCNQD